MELGSLKLLEVKDYETTFTIQKKMDFFHKGINLLRTGDEKILILDPCCEDERANMASHAGTLNVLFYMHLHIIHG